jgi:transcriptional regulator with XRE-family HTH domain
MFYELGVSRRFPVARAILRAGMSDADYEALGSALRVFRRKAGMTQQQAGAAAKVGSKHISAAELGERGLSYKTILALTRAYGTTLQNLAREIERTQR